MNFFNQKLQLGFVRQLTPIVKYLLIANSVMFVFTHLFGNTIFFWIQNWLALSSESIFPRFQLWKLITYMFLHAGIWHFLFNMLALWMFGCDVEEEMGTLHFIKLYLYSGVAAGLFHILIIPEKLSLLVGASGALYGILVAFGIIFRERVITLLLFFILPIQIKAKYLVALLVGGSFMFFLFLGSESQTAHLAHLGGALFGLGYFYFPVYYLTFTGYLKAQNEIKIQKAVQERKQNLDHIREEIDVILDKINEVGFDDLSDKEKEILKKYSQMLPGKDDQ